MKVRLTFSFELTDERIRSSYARPLLVDLRNRKAYGPNDTIESYPEWGLWPAAVHVAHMTSTDIYTDEEKEFIKRFCGTRGRKDGN